MSEYLDELIASGFIRRDFTWSLASKEESALSHYRLSDNYLRFYIKFIAPRLAKIKKGQLRELSLLSLPGFDSLMGYQFENIVLNNRHLLYQALGIKPEEIVFDNPFFQRHTTKQKGCQIDYLIQTQLGSLYVCEIKFSRNEIKANVVNEVKEKIKALKRPKGLACIPVLIYVSPIKPVFEEHAYFGKILDFSDFFC